jgi:hydrogenase maturation protein HypF
MLYNLKGEVDNRTDGVFVIIEGEEDNVVKFREHILKSPPAASQIKSIELKIKKVNGYDGFTITESKGTLSHITEISPDIAVCPECLKDLIFDEERINYPFVNCTNCGPRFSIIESLPYDRSFTSMKDFKMCPDCESEYHNVADRRFHAQPVACNKCGPVYKYSDSENTLAGIDEILSMISEKINSGETVAVKGIGGYHLMCNALDNNAVSELRRRKHRDAKPFAVMFRDLLSVREYCLCNTVEEDEIVSWRRPIVILKQKKKLSDSVSNGLDTIGAMLPYMPLHYMLFSKLNTPVVVLTSGNLTDEPIIIDDQLAKKEFVPVTESVLSYNRKIVNRSDDSVVRIIGDKRSLIRRSRGFVPSPVDLNCNVDGIIAMGAEQKNSFCIGRDNQAIMSQYIGDLKNLTTYEFYKESMTRFQEMFRFIPRIIACDLHPDYLSTAYAGILHEKLNIPVIKVQHHHAHVASCMAENHLDERVIGISMDGTGYGTDGNSWGGEFLIADLEKFSRYTHFDYVQMPGGDKAVEEPWRMAFSYLYKYFGNSIKYTTLPVFQSIPLQQMTLVREMIDKSINSPNTSGAGRLFDAVSALLGLCSISGFDSEAPMRLASVISTDTEGYYPFYAGKTVSFSKTFEAILTDIPKIDTSIISARFHNTVALAITEVAVKMRKETSVQKAVLSGGVFQNKYLLTKVTELLTEKNFEVYSNHLVPSNDGGVSLGQLIVASKYNRLCV